ncbi:MAG: SDR family oxidoreductase [Deltaproteobacteria bacterium]|nr:SDR family oxidoreductase [Deltaproteobacteria bacterium]
MNPGRLQGRVAIITGGARGIGKAIAFKIVQEGALVSLLDILGDLVAQTAEELRAIGGKALGLKADVRQKEKVGQAVQRTLDHFGRMDILVNNAGIVQPALLEDVKEEDWEAVVNTNLKGTLICTRAVLPTMKKNRYGKIINIGSRSSLGKELRTVYSATKAGLIGMTRTWALELAPHNINVNYVGPGPIATELFKASNPEDSPKTRALVNGIPLKRMGEPEDVANLVSFLASDESSFITGQAIFICGGLTVGIAHY